MGMKDSEICLTFQNGFAEPKHVNILFDRLK